MYQIYKIENKINKKFYIGVTKSKYRFSGHISAAKNTNINRPLLNAIRKYGRNNFDYKILENGNNYIYGYKVREPFFIKKLKPEYNLTSGGDGVRDYVMSEEVKKRIISKLKGQKRTKASKKRISVSVKKWHKEFGITEEMKKKMSISAKKSINIKQRANHLNRKITCLCCNLTTNFANLKRWGHRIKC